MDVDTLSLFRIFDFCGDLNPLLAVSKTMRRFVISYIKSYVISSKNCKKFDVSAVTYHCCLLTERAVIKDDLEFMGIINLENKIILIKIIETAIKHNKIKIIKWLLSKKSEEDFNIFYLACKYENLTVLDMFIDHKEYDVMDPACINKSIKIVEFALKRGKSLDLTHFKKSVLYGDGLILRYAIEEEIFNLDLMDIRYLFTLICLSGNYDLALYFHEKFAPILAPIMRLGLKSAVTSYNQRLIDFLSQFVPESEHEKIIAEGKEKFAPKHLILMHQFAKSHGFLSLSNNIHTISAVKLFIKKQISEDVINLVGGASDLLASAITSHNMEIVEGLKHYADIHHVKCLVLMVRRTIYIYEVFMKLYPIIKDKKKFLDLINE